MMAVVNVLLNSNSGFGLPKTACLKIPGCTSIVDFCSTVEGLLPSTVPKDVYLTTIGGRRISTTSTAPISSLLKYTSKDVGATNMLPLALATRLRGGKGGFGSQLRAAGGRMSSRKKKQNAELATSSARNLDGRRLRTITEAKNLATYLATKPDMDRKEKEERRKRWEAVVELAEQREADMRAGKTIDGRRKGLSSEWIEEKEELGENIKNAVKAAMSAADQDAALSQSKNSTETSTSESADEDSEPDDLMELDETDMARLRREAETGDVDALWVLQNKLKIPKDLLPKVKTKPRRFAGFDDDLSDSSSGSEHEISLSAPKVEQEA